MSTTEIIQEAERILFNAQIEANRTVTAFQLHQPLERPSGTWLVARDSAERRHGSKLVKFYSE